MVAMDAPEQLLTATTVARLLHFDRRTIQRMCESGELAARKIRGRWRIQPASVRALVPGEPGPAKPEGAVA